MRRAGTKNLIVSIHDVTPAYADRVQSIFAFLAELAIERGVLLVVPNFHRRWALDEHPMFCDLVRGRLELGWELALHGYTHWDDSVLRPKRRRDRIALRVMTAQEGEFLILDRDEAARRLASGKTMLKRALGVEPAGFVPPAWLCGAGCDRAIAECGLAYSEDHLYLKDYKDGRKLFAPVMGWASRSRSRRISSTLGAAILRRPMALLPVVRLAIHPADFGHQSLIGSIREAIQRFLEAGFRPATNLDVLGG